MMNFVFLSKLIVSPAGDHISGRPEIWKRAAKGLHPLAVPEKIIGLTLILDFFDRCDSLASLHLPQAALGSLPTGASPRAGFRVHQSKKIQTPAWVSVFFGGD